MRKARFPRETIPSSVVTVQFVTFALLLVVIGVLTVAIRGTLRPELLLLPVVLAALYGFVVGCALAVAILHAYFRDVAPILGAALLPWFFVSPIFFDVDEVVRNATYRALLTWANPIAPFITAVRDVLYAGVWPGAAIVGYVLAAAALALAVGTLLFRRMQGELAVVV